MKTAKKILCVLLALLMLLPLASTTFADDDSPDNPVEEIPELKSLDTSAIDGKMFAYIGEESYFVVYPEPTEAESRFDIRNAEITCSEAGIVDFRPEKEEQYRFGSVIVTGLKLGKAVITVKEPESGATCSVEVTVLPGFISKMINLYHFLPLVPYLIFMRIASIISQYIPT